MHMYLNLNFENIKYETAKRPIGYKGLEAWIPYRAFFCEEGRQKIEMVQTRNRLAPLRKICKIN